MFDFKHRIIPHKITYTVIVLILLYQLTLKHFGLHSFLNLGIAFITMDIIHFSSTLLKKYQIEVNNIVIPIVLWIICSLIFNNLIFIILFILLYFLSYKLKINFKIYSILWFTTLLLLIFAIYKTIFIQFLPNRLIIILAGIGIIYFICEVLFYLLSLPLIKFGILKFETNEPEKSMILSTIGGGDITVFALISIFLGFKAAFLTLFIASLFSLISHFTLWIVHKFKKESNEQFSNYIPFVPYLSLACFIIIIKFNAY